LDRSGKQTLMMIQFVGKNISAYRKYRGLNTGWLCIFFRYVFWIILNPKKATDCSFNSKNNIIFESQTI